MSRNSVMAIKAWQGISKGKVANGKKTTPTKTNPVYQILVNLAVIIEVSIVY